MVQGVIQLLFIKENNVYLVMFPDGRAEIVTDPLLAWNQSTILFFVDHLTINLNSLLLGKFSEINGGVTTFYKQYFAIRKDEHKLLDVLRVPSVKTVFNKDDAGKVLSAELTRKVDGENIIDILQRDNFGKYSLGGINGKVSYFHREEKFKNINELSEMCAQEVITIERERLGALVEKHLAAILEDTGARIIENDIGTVDAVMEKLVMRMEQGGAPFSETQRKGIKQGMKEAVVQAIKEEMQKHAGDE